MPKMSTPEVKPGQVWADNDRRSAGRTIRVDSVEDGKATVTVLTNARGVLDSVGRQSKITLSRFRPTSTGYRLVSEAGDAR